jgi:hypothetical protein
MAKDNLAIETDNEDDIDKRIEAAAKSSADRVRSEYSRKLKDLQAELDEVKTAATEKTEKAVSTLDDLQNEIAEVRAQKLLVAKQSEMLQKAADHDIDAALAIRFAETADSNGTFELAIAEIERRTNAQVNKRLGATPPPKGSPMGPQGYDLTKMTQSERDRLPPSLRDAAFKNYLHEVTNNA